MNRKHAIKTLLAGAVTLPTVATAQSDLARDIRAEFATAWDRSCQYTLTVFNQIPEDRLDYRYTPESFSFRTQFVHCIVFTAAQLAGRLDIKNPYEGKTKDYWDKLTKAALATDIQSFYDWVKQTMTGLSDKALLETENYAGEEMPKWRVFYALENHIIHHRGQAICYIRLNGITPEGYIGW
jgi:uncharacterized damage-inducible protein DinB